MLDLKKLRNKKKSRMLKPPMIKAGKVYNNAQLSFMKIK